MAAPRNRFKIKLQVSVICKDHKAEENFDAMEAAQIMGGLINENLAKSDLLGGVSGIKVSLQPILS